LRLEEELVGAASLLGLGLGVWLLPISQPEAFQRLLSMDVLVSLSYGSLRFLGTS
jgi:hypothetical protein